MHMSIYSEATTSRAMAPTVEDEDLENNTEVCINGSNDEKTSMVRNKSELAVITNNNDGRLQMLRNFMSNLQVVVFGTKLVVLFPAVPLAIVANFCSFGRVSNIIHANYIA